MWSDRGGAILGLSILFFTVMATASYYKENGIGDLSSLRQDIDQMRAQADDIGRENLRLQTELENFTASDYQVEKLARESLGLVKPGEVTYEFVDAKTLKPRSYAR